MHKKSFDKLSRAAAVLLTAAGLLAAPKTHAGTEAPATTNVIEETKKSYLSGDMGVAMVSEYIYHGLVVENQGAIAQPYLDIYAKAYESTGFINRVSVGMSFWSSIHSHVQPIGNTDTTRNWFEFDYNPSLAVGFAKNFTLTLGSVNVTSPASAFITEHSVRAILDYNDSDLLGAFALHPRFTLFRALPNGAGFAGLGPNGWSYELGFYPTYILGRGHTYPVTFVFPTAVGLGSHHFYAGNAFGFATTGITAAVPLAFIPEGYGTWTATAGYSYYYLGHNVAEVTATGHRNQHVFSGAIGVTF